MESWGPRKRAERDVGCGKPRYGKAEADANRVERTAPQDAKVSFEDGKFTLQAETGGNTLRDGAVHDAIAQALTGVVDMGQEPQTIEAELTDIDCYEVPEITEENTAFDMQESFKDAARWLFTDCRLRKSRRRSFLLSSPRRPSRRNRRRHL